MVQIRITVNGNFRNANSVSADALEEEYEKLLEGIDAEMENTVMVSKPNYTVTRGPVSIRGTAYTDVILIDISGNFPAPTDEVLGRMVDNLYESHPYVGSGHAGLRPEEGNDALADCAFPGIGADLVQAGGRRGKKPTRRAKARKSITRKRKNRRHA